MRLGPEQLLPPEPKRVSFYDTVWNIDGISNIEFPIVRIQDGSPSVVFKLNNTFVLQTGCNEGRGRYTVKSESIDVEIVEFTGNTCLPDTLSRMDEILNKLFSRSTFQVKKETNKLTFAARNGEILMEAKSTE